MYGENHASGDRAMIENLTIKIQWLCHPLSAVYYVFIPFATIISPASAGFEIGLYLPVGGNGRTLMTQIKRIYADFDLTRIERIVYKNKQDAIFYPINAG